MFPEYVRFKDYPDWLKVNVLEAAKQAVVNQTWGFPAKALFDTEDDNGFSLPIVPLLTADMQLLNENEYASCVDAEPWICTQLERGRNGQTGLAPVTRIYCPKTEDSTIHFRFALIAGQFGGFPATQPIRPFYTTNGEEVPNPQSLLLEAPDDSDEVMQGILEVINEKVKGRLKDISRYADVKTMRKYRKFLLSRARKNNTNEDGYWNWSTVSMDRGNRELIQKIGSLLVGGSLEWNGVKYPFLAPAKNGGVVTTPTSAPNNEGLLALTQMAQETVEEQETSEELVG